MKPKKPALTGALRAWLWLLRKPKGLLLCLLVLFLAAPGKGSGSDTSRQPPRNDRGFSYFHDEVRDVPWSIHVVKMERARSDLQFHTTLGSGNTLGMGLVSEQAHNLPARLGRPVAAINGDFYHRTGFYAGDPEGLQIIDGELVSGPLNTRVCLWFDSTGNPHRTNVAPQFKATWPDGTTLPFGLNEDRESDEAVLYTSVAGVYTRENGGLDFVLERKGDAPWLPLQIGQTYSAQVREVREAGRAPLSRDLIVLSVGWKLTSRLPKIAPGAVLKISTATVPDLSGAKTAIGGGPTLVRGGSAMPYSGFQPRHPRSAVGWNKDYIFMVEVDGRQRNLSVGMTLPELAAYMIKLGCDEAMNFDGGGSATLWVMGNVMNSPSEGKERPSANALVLVQKPK